MYKLIPIIISVFLVLTDSRAELKVEYQLVVKQQPILQVLAKAGELTGSQVHYFGPKAYTVSASCRELLPDAFFACLLKPNADVVYRYQFADQTKQRRQLAEVWIESINGQTGSGELIGNVEQVKKPLSDFLNNVGSEKTARIIADITQANKAQFRASAVAALASSRAVGNMQKSRILESALADQSAEVRAQAVAGLAKQQKYDSTSVLANALSDEDVSVRLMAVDSAGDNSELLHQALTDSDETVRQYAALKLQALNP